MKERSKKKLSDKVPFFFSLQLKYAMSYLAILAVVLGGTSMTGGKFSLTGTIIGSLIIRTITTLVYYFGITSESIMAFKAVIILVVIIIQSEPIRKRLAVRKSRKQKAGAFHG